MGSSLARRDGLLEERYVDSLPFMLWVSEKAAEEMFPTIQGEFDYKGFSVSSTDGIQWCKELFHHFWDPAKRRPEPFPYGNP
jgi:predicted transcriptional regulator